jgi:catechol 2,3-dioxygenase-like lactoylglutathione lyase family enzyme
MAVRDVTVVSVPVSDQERAKAFYVDTLGLELVRDDDSMPGIRWIQVAPKGRHHLADPGRLVRVDGP